MRRPASRRLPTRSPGARTCSTTTSGAPLPVSRSSRAGAPSMPQKRSAARRCESVEALVDSSLLLRAFSSGLVRFVLLETVREHAAELLDDAGDRAATRELAWRLLHRPGRGHRPDRGHRFRCDRRARPRARQPARGVRPRRGGGDHDTALRIATALYYYWYLKGYFREGRDRIRRPLDRGAGSERLQALAYGALAGLTWLLGDGEEAEALAKRGIDTGRDAGALEAVMRCHTVLGMVARDRGELAEAASHMHSSGALAEELGARGGRHHRQHEPCRVGADGR